MTEPKFTPGPWKVERYGENSVIRAADQCVGEVYRSEFEPQTLPTKYNAALIAAAPDLYAALSQLDDAFISATNWAGDPPQEIVNARAALRKARGES